MLQLEGNRHDVQGLYSFLDTSFRGCLLADNGYWPKQDKRIALEEHGITVIACTRSNQKHRHTKSNAALLKNIVHMWNASLVCSTSSSTRPERNAEVSGIMSREDGPRRWLTMPQDLSTKKTNGQSTLWRTWEKSAKPEQCIYSVAGTVHD